MLDPRNGNAPIGLTVTGEIMSQSSSSFSWSTYPTPAITLNQTYNSANANGLVGQNSYLLTQTGYTDSTSKAHTLTFAQPVSDVVMGLWSLGGGNAASTLVFSQPFQILSSNGASMAGSKSRFSAGGDAQTGYYLTGYEGNGVIQFLGTYTEIKWDVTEPEYYSGFNIGMSNNPVTGYGTVTPSTQTFPLPQGFTVAPVIRPINAADDVVSGLGTVTTRVFDGGTLTLAANNSDAYTLTNKGGSMKVASGSTVIASGIISNEGGDAGFLKKVGAGRLVLSANNTYTGGTTVEAGVLEVSSNSNLGASTGGVTLNGGTLATTSDISTSRPVIVGASNGTLDVASGKDLAIAGVLSGAGTLNKTSAGRLILSGANTHTGAMNVDAGTLVLNGSTASSTLNVGSSAVLAGSGSTAGSVALAGTARPGNSPGTFSVAGNFTMDSVSNLETEIDGRTYSATGGAGSYDRIALTGADGVFTANGTLTPILRGISGAANNDFSPVVGDAFRIVTTAGATGVDATGAFTAVADPTAANGMPENTRFDVIYGGNFIDLVLTPKNLEAFAKPYGIQNMVNAARAFDGIRPAQGTRGTSDTYKLFNGLYGLSADAMSKSVLQASGEIHAFALSEARQGWQASTGAIGAVAGVKADRNLWVDVSGENIKYKQDGYASAYTSNRTHLWIGTHVHEYKDTQIGVAAGVTTRQVNAQQSGTARLDSQALAIYAIGRKAQYDYTAVVSLNQSSIDTTRQTLLSTGAQSNTSDSSAQGTVVSLSAGMKHAVTEKVDGRLWVSGMTDETRARAFSEQGSTVTGLGVASESFRSSQVSLGYTLSGSFPVAENKPGVWMLGAGVSHMVEQGRPQVSRQMALQGATWQVTTPKLGLDTQFVRAGVRVPLASNAEAWLNLGASTRQGATARDGNVGVSIRW